MRVNHFFFFTFFYCFTLSNYLQANKLQQDIKRSKKQKIYLGKEHKILIAFTKIALSEIKCYLKIMFAFHFKVGSTR